MAMATCDKRNTVSDAILSPKGSGRIRHGTSYNFLEYRHVDASQQRCLRLHTRVSFSFLKHQGQGRGWLVYGTLKRKAIPSQPERMSGKDSRRRLTRNWDILLHQEGGRQKTLSLLPHPPGPGTQSMKCPSTEEWKRPGLRLGLGPGFGGQASRGRGLAEARVAHARCASQSASLPHRLLELSRSSPKTVDEVTSRRFAARRGTDRQA